VLDGPRGGPQTGRWSRMGRRLSVTGPAGWGFESPRRHRCRSSIGQSSGHSAVTHHARPGLCLSRSGYPLVVVPGRSLHSRATSEERMVRVGRRRSVTTFTGRVAGSSPAATGRESAGGVAQLVEQLPAVNPTPTRTPRKSGPESLRLPGDGSAGSSLAPGSVRRPGNLLGGDMPPFRRAPPRPLVRTIDDGGGGPKRDRLSPSQGALGGGQPERSGPAGSHPTPAAAFVCPEGV
jgi:hypothetical protein